MKTLEKKGSGAIIFVGAIAVKASSVDRAFSMKNLCKRLGEFAPGDYAAEPEPVAPEPVSPALADDWKEFRAERDRVPARQSEPPSHSALAELKKRHRLERKRLARRLAGHTLSAINRARHGLAAKQRQERKAAVGPRPRSGQRRPGFKAWLKAHGRARQANLWRYCNRPLASAPSSSSPPPVGSRLTPKPPTSAIGNPRAGTPPAPALSRQDARIGCFCEWKVTVVRPSRMPFFATPRKAAPGRSGTGGTTRNGQRPTLSAWPGMRSWSKAVCSHRRSLWKIRRRRRNGLKMRRGGKCRGYA
jgi:hypothetical protein